MALMALGALLLHEAFHLVALLTGPGPQARVELTPFGGVMDVDGFGALPPGRRFGVAAAGVLGSLAAGGHLLSACSLGREIAFE